MILRCFADSRRLRDRTCGIRYARLPDTRVYLDAPLINGALGDSLLPLVKTIRVFAHPRIQNSKTGCRTAESRPHAPCPPPLVSQLCALACCTIHSHSPFIMLYKSCSFPALLAALSLFVSTAEAGGFVLGTFHVRAGLCAMSEIDDQRLTCFELQTMVSARMDPVVS